MQQDKADAAAQRIEQFVDEIERQFGWTTRARWAAGPLDQRRFDYVRLLRQVPAITELTELDGAGSRWTSAAICRQDLTVFVRLIIRHSWQSAPTMLLRSGLSVKNQKDRVQRSDGRRIPPQP